MSNPPLPVRLNRTAQNELEIDWSDGLRQTVSIRQLRALCPCAHCREKAEAGRDAAKKPGLPILSAAALMPLDIVGMQPVGNYGYNIQFSDGHASGIFTFDFLREMLTAEGG